MLNMRCLGGKYQKHNIAILVYFVTIFITKNVLTQDLLNGGELQLVDADNDTESNEATAWCFRFTWLGPKYDKNSKTFLNQTCKDVIGLNKGIPCVTPLVVTNNSNYPDTDWIWEQHQRKPGDIACKAAGGDICAKYSYFFNGRVENVTYLCTKVNIENGTSPTSGCFKESRNNRVTEVCVCEPQAGGKPCNTGFSLQFHVNLIMIFVGCLITLL
ncbi:uncharacterized protein LOC134836864 [Culicoides brevitarsis]|uniref:uncharacterized protein LOC134836864 n=1 Tax=Culicoides brevitarsis TaxID=469753 RepID=UPI00307C60E3